MKSTFWMSAEQAEAEIKRRELGLTRTLLAAVFLRHALRHVAYDARACQIIRTAYESISPYTEVTL